MVLGLERKRRRWRCFLRRLRCGQSCHKVAKGEGETNIARIVLLILASVSHIQQDLCKERWMFSVVDVHVVSLCALSSPVRTVRAIATDPQLPTRKRSVMSLLGIRLVLAALTRLRMTLVDRARSFCDLGGGDF